MKEFGTKQNVFVVNTPHQLLNAIEAVHSLQLANNHLLVIRPENGGHDRFKPLIEVSDWATKLSIRINGAEYSVQKLLALWLTDGIVLRAPSKDVRTG